jgi:glycosyltransferase involved in cell wall biosynthesis
LGRKLIAWSLSRANRVVALSQAWRAKLRDMSPEARIVVVENAVAMPEVVPSRGGAGRCRFALLARMDEWKGIDDLLAACAKLRGAGVELDVELAGPPGTAGDAATLARKIEALDLEGNVRYVGPVHGEEKAELLRGADVYIQPSHHEGMPISLLEALGFGLPVVATSVGAVPEVITDGSEGLLVPPHRSDLLAAAMRAVATDPTGRQRMSRAARRRVSARFGLDRFRNDLLSLYHELDRPAA